MFPLLYTNIDVIAAGVWAIAICAAVTLLLLITRH